MSVRIRKKGARVTLSNSSASSKKSPTVVVKNK